MLEQSLVFLDLETTGATPTSDRITEIGLVEVANGEHPGLMLVRVAVGSACLIARVTARAWHALGLSVGEPVWLQVKTVALVN